MGIRRIARFILLSLLIAGCALPPGLGTKSPPEAAVQTAPALTPTVPAQLPTGNPPEQTQVVPTGAQANPTSHLVEWTPGRAIELAEQLRKLPSGGNELTGTDFFLGWRFSALAYEEAALRFTDHPDRQSWRWAAAYSHAEAGGSERAAALYAELIQEALVKEGLSLEHLADGFTTRQVADQTIPAGETPLSLAATSSPLASAPDTTRRLLQVQSLQNRGGACFLIQEDQRHISVIALASRFDRHTAAVGVWQSCGPVDVDGDGLDEVLITTGVGGNQLTQEITFRIADVSEGQAGWLPFTIDGLTALTLGVGGGSLVGLEGRGGKPALHMIETPGNTCPVEIHRWFAWNSAWLEEIDVELRFLERMEGITGCLAGWPERLAEYPQQIAVRLIEDIIVHYPPGSPIYTHPSDYDEWKMRHAISLALIGRVSDARTALNRIIRQPQADSPWSEPARRFLRNFHEPADLYMACAAEPICDPSQAVRALPQTLLSPDDLDVVDRGLATAGIPVGMQLTWDFEGDDQLETLVTLAGPGDSGWRLWVFAVQGNKVVALDGGPVAISQPKPVPYSDLYTPQAVRIDEQDILAFRRAPNGQPYLTRHRSNPTPDLDRIYYTDFISQRDRLLAGEDPALVLSGLRSLSQQSSFSCDLSADQPSPADNYCPDLLYFSALAAEISGDASTALESYLQLQREFPDHPFAVMAASKVDTRSE